jgi:hypothetical protein
MFDGRSYCISAVDADGVWTSWESASPDGPWRASRIARGLAPRAPTTCFAAGPYAFAADGRGGLLVARPDRRGWDCTVVTASTAGGPIVPIVPVTPRQVLISREVVAAAELGPVEIELANRYRRELWVLIADVQNPNNVIRLKIKPDESQKVVVNRDGGSRVVETFQVVDAFGGTRIEQNVFDVPPQSLYDVSVYELWLQSVAIDRTRRGGGKLEDVNWSPKSVGIFPLPAGPALENRAVLDVYATAQAGNNPGGVRRLELENWKESD